MFVRVTVIVTKRLDEFQQNFARPGFLKQNLSQARFWEKSSKPFQNGVFNLNTICRERLIVFESISHQVVITVPPRLS